MLYNQPKLPLKNCASCRGRACPACSLPPYPFYDSIRRGRDSSLPGTLPPPQTATAARGLAALRPHIKPVRRAGCPHPAETYRHIPFPHRRPVGAGHARPAAYRNIPFTVQSAGEGFIPPGNPPAAANGHGGQRAGRPTPHIKPVRRAGCPHPAETCRPLHAPSVHFPKFIHFFVKKSTQKIFFVL